MFSNILLGAAGFPVADLGDTVSQSLRFIGGSQTMQRTFSSTFNASGTLSAWIKVGSSDDAYFFGGNVSGHYEIIGQASQQFYGADRFGSNTYANGKQRDYSGWYHICINFNSGNWWINGQQQSNNLALSNHSNMNNWNVGYSIQGSRPFDGYMAAVIFVDGSDIAETNFGKYNDDGVWVPQDYTGTYGTNGFHLDFADSSNLGNDVSGNNNDFTASGFDTAAISSSNPDNDIDFNDTPTSNYATFSPLRNSAHALTDANLKGTSSSNYTGFPSTIDVDMSVAGQKYYVEYFISSVSGPYPAPAVVYGGDKGIIWGNAHQPGAANYKGFSVGANGTLIAHPIDGSHSSTSSFHPSFSANDVIALTINTDTRELIGYRNGTQFPTVIHTFNSDDVISFAGVPDGPVDIQINYGQMPFIQTPPSGFKALQTNNLPEPLIKNGKDHFGVVTYTGDGTTGRDITGLNFQPDFVWLKARSIGYHNRFYDVIRGTNVSLVTDQDYPDQTNSGSLTAFNSDGFEIGTATAYNQSNETYVGWCWKAGGTPVSNTDGSITSSVSANPDAGFSIVGYTGTGANATVGHGLNSAPEMIIVKNRDSNVNWVVYHVEADATAPEDYILILNSTGNQVDNSTMWNDTAPTSSVFSVGSAGHTNSNGQNLIAYCWHSVEGYSKFGSYTGNGSIDGPYIHLGFRPAFLLIKLATSTSSNMDWVIWDSTRSTSNSAKVVLFPNKFDSEATGTDRWDIDFLSNGFKIRNGYTESNTTSNNGTYAYMAFAENPFGGKNQPPATAR